MMGFFAPPKVISSQELAIGYIFYTLPFGADITQYFQNVGNTNKTINHKIRNAETVFQQYVALSPDIKDGLKGKYEAARNRISQRGFNSGDLHLLFALDISRDEILENAQNENFPLHEHILWAEYASDVGQYMKYPNNPIHRVINPYYHWQEKGIDVKYLSKESYQNLEISDVAKDLHTIPIEYKNSARALKN